MNDLTKYYVGWSGNLNPNLKFLLDERMRRRWRIYALQGGTRSGKTYSVVKYVVWVIEHFSGLTISFVRATLPAIKATVLRDFEEVMMEEGLWSDRNFNKTALEYRHNGNLVEFFSVDDEQKVRGRKRDVLIINEANEVSQPKYQQLIFRTTAQVIIDYNPSMVTSYIYDDVLTRDDACMLITTYLDNPHLTAATINEIELLKERDPELWKVYGCGQRGTNRAGLIYTDWKRGAFPDDLPCWYAADFGFANDPTAIVRLAYDAKRNTVHVHEVAYQKGLHNNDIARIIRQDMATKRTVIHQEDEPVVWVEDETLHVAGHEFAIDDYRRDKTAARDALLEAVPKSEYKRIVREIDHIADCVVDAYFDSAEPKSISELRTYGILAHPCVKGVGSIVSQIQFVKNFTVIYTADSTNIDFEVNAYKWLQRKDDDKNFENKPQAGNDHAMDAIRYGIFNHLSRYNETFRTISQIKQSR